MNKKVQAIVDELGNLADEEAAMKARTSEIKQRRAVLWGRGRKAGLGTADLAVASKVEQVTVRQWDRRRRQEAGT